MNIKLLPNDINVDFMFVPPEIYKSNEDIKLLSINDVGTVVIIVTKSNEIRIFDFLGKSVLFKITHFSELSYKVVYISWNSDSSSVYVTYEEIIAKKYALAAGQYFDVKIEYVDMTPEEFNEKMAGYQAELVKLFDEGDKLQKEIIEQLKKVKYE